MRAPTFAEAIAIILRDRPRSLAEVERYFAPVDRARVRPALAELVAVVVVELDPAGSGRYRLVALGGWSAS